MPKLQHFSPKEPLPYQQLLNLGACDDENASGTQMTRKVYKTTWNDPNNHHQHESASQIDSERNTRQDAGGYGGEAAAISIATGNMLGSMQNSLEESQTHGKEISIATGHMLGTVHNSVESQNQTNKQPSGTLN